MLQFHAEEVFIKNLFLYYIMGLKENIEGMEEIAATAKDPELARVARGAADTVREAYEIINEPLPSP